MKRSMPFIIIVGLFAAAVASDVAIDEYRSHGGRVAGFFAAAPAPRSAAARAVAVPALVPQPGRPALALVSAGDHFDVRLAGGNRQLWYVLPLPDGRWAAVAVSTAADGQQTMWGYELPDSGGPSPPPPPPPGPLDGLAKLVHGWVIDKVPEAARPLKAKLAASYASLVAQIAAGAITAIDDLQAKTRAANNAAMGDQVAAWKGWGDALGEYLLAESKAGRLADLPAHRAAWAAIQQGLEAP